MKVSESTNQSSVHLSGPKTLFVKNAFFPAAYVSIGLFIENKLGSYINGLRVSAASGTLGEFALNTTSDLWQGCSLENVQSFGNKTVAIVSSTISSVVHRTPQGPIATAATALSNHYITVGSAAVIGGAATVFDSVLKRMPWIKYHPYLRVGTSIGLATAATYFGATALNLPMNPGVLFEIGTKAVIIGCCAQAILTTTSLGFKASRSSSELFSRIFRAYCTGMVYAADALSWGSLPEGAKNVEPKEEKKVAKFKTVEVSDEDLLALEEVRKARSNPSTPVKGEGVRQRTPVQVSPIEELEALE